MHLDSYCCSVSTEGWHVRADQSPMRIRGSQASKGLGETYGFGRFDGRFVMRKLRRLGISA